MPFKFAIAAAALLTATPAAAEIGPWRVDDSYVVRAQALDLTEREDRATLLAAVETASARLCRSVHTRRARAACEAEAMASAGRAPAVRDAIRLAQTEREIRLALAR